MRKKAIKTALFYLFLQKNQMKKIILLLTLLTVNVIYSQLLKDNSFASNGIHHLPAGTFLVGNLTDTNSSVFYRSFDSNTHQLVISKATSYTGPLDPTFGTNGKIFLDYQLEDLIGFLRHSDNKLTLLCKKMDPATNSPSHFDVIRILPNGQPDMLFGNGGTKILAHPVLFTDLYEQDNKILVAGEGYHPNGSSDSQLHLFRLNNDGTEDSSFGNNGELVIASIPGYILLDQQSSIMCFYAYTIKKYNSNGQVMTSFGNNGEVAVDPPLAISKAFIDSNNKIACIDMVDTGSGFGTVKRINADGSIDPAFNYNPPAGAMLFDLYEKNGHYYVAGNVNANGGHTYYISKLDQSGTVDPSVGNFVENDPNLQNHSIVSIKVFDNSILVYGGEGMYNGTFEVVKYVLNSSSTLSANESIQTKELQIENPVKDQLVITSKEKMSTIDIYSSTGIWVKKLTHESADVSHLASGIYIIKINFQNGKNKTFKIIKK